ncbi:MAG: hypothetical protein DCF28_02140 [Alphaproteobacteria bacterium]|nr:MAG: hypothetical protein DCF28_02140 [Alphaproteobacteria bacterium]PZO38113.1 MAG: hypothetical protein DCE92_06580 [Alphaproteobacteria bacterium]
MAEGVITLRLTILDPVPGVRYSLQKDDAPRDPQTATREPLSFDLLVKLADDGRLLGPFIRREGPERRFVYLRIGQSAGDCASPWNRRAKIDVQDIPASMRISGAVLEVRLPGRGRDGTPACATVRPLETWRLA